jgi:hypothetical protein
MGYGVMKISLQALAGVLKLPEDFKAISVQQDFAQGDMLNIWFSAPSIPDQPADEHPLEIAPRYTVHYNPECPDSEYRKIECEVEIRHHKRLSSPDMLEMLR